MSREKAEAISPRIERNAERIRREKKAATDNILDEIMFQEMELFTRN